MVPKLMIHLGKSKVKMNKSNSCQEVQNGLALMVTIIWCEPEYIRVARQVDGRETSETLVVVFTQAVGVVEVVLHYRVTNNHSCLTAKRIVDAYEIRPLCSTIANFGNTDGSIPKYQKVRKVAGVPHKVRSMKN